MTKTPPMDMKKLSEDALNRKLCGRCTKCCEYINVRLDTPHTEEQFDNILWYLLHKDVYVWVSRAGKWYVRFDTPCRPLKRGRCRDYAARPMLCREYDHKSCERYKPTQQEKIAFHTKKQLLSYLKKRRKQFYGFYEKI